MPTGRSIWAVGSTLNGVTLSAPDVGGTAGMQQTYMATHGSDRRDNAVQVDGMSVNGIEGDGAIQNYFNQGMFEEISYQTSALVAELPSAGVRVNMVPKDGSNSLRGSLFYTQTPSSFQSSNFTPELAALGLKAPNRVQKIIDVNPSFGGPLLKSKLWFFSSARVLGRRSDGDRLVLQRRPHAADLPARPVPADGGRQPDQERHAPPDLSDVAASTSSPPTTTASSSSVATSAPPTPSRPPRRAASARPSATGRGSSSTPGRSPTTCSSRAAGR